MGSWKLMLPFGSSTIVERVVDSALLSCRKIILVAGYRGLELARLFDCQDRVQIVAHDDWEHGMFSSIQAGVRHVETTRFFLCLADLPLLRGDVFTALADEPSAGVVVPTFDGRRGHPVLLGSSVKEQIIRTDSLTGNMREILRGFRLTELEWHDDSILRDTDTPAEYQQLIGESRTSKGCE
jgi:molybdenum cofactor cytidylyltransferase